jgi:5S rRNA maturation endonuclease (ribonuclease M5)
MKNIQTKNKGNVIIVEGKTDKAFMEAYVGHFSEMFPRPYGYLRIENARGQGGIGSVLKTQEKSINTGETKNIGILIDADQEGIDGKIKHEINPAIEKVFGYKDHIKAPNQRFPFEFLGRRVTIFCYILHVNGKGELEDVLEEIRRDKHAKSPDCLKQFVECLGGPNEAYPEKAYKKERIRFYGHECMKKEKLSNRKIKDRLKNYEYYTPDYFYLDHESLDGLKDFLLLFQTEKPKNG